MKKRIKLRDRLLPDYTNGEEVMNMVTHIVGGSFGILVLVLCLVRSSIPRCTVGAAIYGGSMIAIYAMSSIYHGLRPSTGKKVLQILDHCTIYLLIAGSYSAIALGTLFDHFPGNIIRPLPYSCHGGAGSPVGSGGASHYADGH